LGNLASAELGSRLGVSNAEVEKGVGAGEMRVSASSDAGEPGREERLIASDWAADDRRETLFRLEPKAERMELRRPRLLLEGGPDELSTVMRRDPGTRLGESSADEVILREEKDLVCSSVGAAAGTSSSSSEATADESLS
jgi:hypothetical protein